MVPVQENLRAEPNRHPMNATEPSPDASWLNPSMEEQGLARYVSTLRERKWLIALTVLVTTLAAVAYVLTANKVYNAEADLLITPISNSDPTLAGLGLISTSSDPTRDVETASKLVTSTTVAKRVKAKLHDSRTAEQLLGTVSVAPVATSNIVAVTAEGGSPKEAQQLAKRLRRRPWRTGRRTSTRRSTSGSRTSSRR